MVQHVIAQFGDYHFTTLDVFFGTLKLSFKSIDYGFLVVCERLQLVLFQQESIFSFAHFIQFVVGSRDLQLKLSHGFGFVLLGQLDFLLNALFSVPGSSFELFELFLCVFEFALIHFLQNADLLRAALDCLLQVIDRLKTALELRLAFDEACLEGIVLFLRHHGS